jgi:hypothetical protein
MPKAALVKRQADRNTKKVERPDPQHSPLIETVDVAGPGDRLLSYQ